MGNKKVIFINTLILAIIASLGITNEIKDQKREEVRENQIKEVRELYDQAKTTSTGIDRIWSLEEQR